MSTGFPSASGGFAAGSRIAAYLLEEQIGQGGMAVVFRAHEERLDRTVALKILAPAFADDQAFRQRFIRESRAAAAVDDPHIIPVFEAGEASGVLFIAMRYVRGGDVGSLVRRIGPLPLTRLAPMVSQVASALDAAHARGLVHRDVKPANMLLDASGGAGRPDHVYLSDFGLSKTSLQVSGLTASGQFLGTLDYVAPEQIESKPLDGRADQYALACSTFELLTGTPPFQRGTALALILAQLSDPPPSLTDQRPDLPGGLDRVLARALAKAPADRYRTCTEFAEALRAAGGLRSYQVGTTLPPTEHPATMAATAGDLAEAGAPEAAGAGARLAGAGGSGPPGSGGTPRDGTLPPRAGTVNPNVGTARPDEGMPTAEMTTDPGQRHRAAAVTPAGWASAEPRVSRAARDTANPARTEHLTAAGSPAGPPAGRRRVLAGAAALVLIAAAAVLIKLATSSHSPGPGRSTPPPSGSPSINVVSACGSVVGGSSGAFRAGPTLTDRGGGSAVVEGAAFSPDSSQLAVADHNGVTYIWNVASASLITRLPDPSGSGVQAVAFSCDGKSVATSDNGGNALMWTISSSTPSSPFTDPSGAQTVFAVALSPNRLMLATGDSNGNAYLWNLRNDSSVLLANPGAPGNAVQGIAFSPDGTMLATGDSNGTTYLWNVATHKRVAVLPDSNIGGNGVQAVAFSPDGMTLAAGDSSGTTYLWDTSTHGQTMSLSDPSPSGAGVVAVAFSPDGGTLATGDGNGNTYLWDFTSYQRIATLTSPASGIYGVQALAFSPDGRMLAIGDVNGRTYLWQR